VAVKQIVTQESINPNIIPMIDIMFLILLFFMLSADMGQRELEDVKLPMADNVKEDKPQSDDVKTAPRIMVNCYHVPSSDLKCPNFSDDAGDLRDLVCVDESHWRIGIKGHTYTPEQLKDVLEKAAEPERRDPKNPRVSERKLQIRADRSAIYGHVQKVMNTCAEVGIYKVELGAATKKAKEE
jgi:biopolymer transport protein ExbD